MSDTTLRDLVLKRLDADTQPEDEWSALVLAALEGPDDLAKLLDEGGLEAAKPLWRNLHHPKAAIAAEFALEGEKGTCTVAREWQDGPDLDAATTWAQVHGRASYRPFLSYNELGSMLDEGPSKLYDALSKVLGLDALVDAQATLQQARATRDKAQKDADQDRKALLAKLEGTTDERAAKVSATSLLQRLSVLQPPDPVQVKEATKALRDAEKRQAAAAQTVAGKSEQLATLLDHALSFHKAHGDGPCPVCGREKALDSDWHQAKANEAADLRHAANEATEARAGLKTALAELKRLLTFDLDLVGRVRDSDLPATKRHRRRILRETAGSRPQTRQGAAP